MTKCDAAYKHRFERSKTRWRCENDAVEGCMYCAQHRIEALARIPAWVKMQAAKPVTTD